MHGKIDNQLLDYFWATFTPIEYLVFTYFLLSNISYRGFKKIIIFSSIFFVVFTIFYNIYADLHKIDSTPIGIESILIFIYSFFYFYEQMKDTSTLFIYNKYHFWIVIGYLIYLSGSFFIFIFTNQLDDELLNQYWFITSVSYSTMNILFAIGFYIKAKSAKRATLFLQKFHPYLNNFF